MMPTVVPPNDDELCAFYSGDSSDNMIGAAGRRPTISGAIEAS